MKELIIETVANGFIVKDPAHYEGTRYKRDHIFVFSNPAQLVAWMEKWSIERKKEMGK